MVNPVAPHIKAHVRGQLVSKAHVALERNTGHEERVVSARQHEAEWFR